MGFPLDGTFITLVHGLSSLKLEGYYNEFQGISDILMLCATFYDYNHI